MSRYLAIVAFSLTIFNATALLSCPHIIVGTIGGRGGVCRNHVKTSAIRDPLRSRRPNKNRRGGVLFDSATASDDGMSESQIRKLAFRQMAAYMWPKEDPRTKVLLVASLSFLLVGKILNAQVPFILQRAVDTSNNVLPLALFFLYGISRAATVALNELKTTTFAHVSQRALRRFSNTIFRYTCTFGRDRACSPSSNAKAPTPKHIALTDLFLPLTVI